MAENTRMTNRRDMELLRAAAAQVAAFKARVQTDGMTRPGRTPEERALLEQAGVVFPFIETGVAVSRGGRRLSR